MAITLNGARLIDAAGERPNCSISFDGTSISLVGNARGNSQAVDLDGMIITPGFIDVHTHGGGGYNLHTTDPSEIRAYRRWAPTTGTTAFLAGIVGVAGGLPEAQLAAVAHVSTVDEIGAEMLGVHLEGPYMSVKRRGAHDPAWLREPSEAETERLLELAGEHLRIVTLAPELPGAEAMIRRLVATGVTVSVGHTDASYEQAVAAFELGASHMTHCFNAMRPLHHREPGPLGALLEAERAQGEIIGDGVHVHPAVLRLLIRALGPERTVIITDALAGAGVPDGCFLFAGNEARVVDGVARLPDGTITGSVLTMEQALRNVVQFADVPLQQAVRMFTLNPARAAGVGHRKGLLRPGYDADLLIFDQELVLQATICRGSWAFTVPAFQARLDPAF